MSAPPSGSKVARPAAFTMEGRRKTSVAEAHQVYWLYHRQTSSNVTNNNAGESTTAASVEQTASIPQYDDLFQAASKPSSLDRFPMFHPVQKTGVIYATSRAAARGFVAYDPVTGQENDEWANMGQGAPETGPIPQAPSRAMFDHCSIAEAELEYAPVTGLPALCQKVADYYNVLYRQGLASQYTAANVCIVPGGRAGITRIMVRFTFKCCREDSHLTVSLILVLVFLDILFMILSLGSPGYGSSWLLHAGLHGVRASTRSLPPGQSFAAPTSQCQ
jgi:hypothetical protein